MLLISDHMDKEEDVYAGRHLEIIQKGKEAKSKTLQARKDYNKTARKMSIGP